MLGSDLYACFLESSGVSTDTRDALNGKLFFALKGGNFNGNKFALKALDSGAKAVVIDEKVDGLNADDVKVFFVPNVLSCLQELAKYHRTQFNIPVLALTGTNGKTTTKELIALLLSNKFNVLSTKGNLNNHIGVPLTLLRLTSEHDFAVIEMGASKLGDIKELCGIALPNYGLITNIGVAHVEGFGSIENIAKTKSELYHFLDSNRGVVFYNIDEDSLLEPISNLKNSEIIHYSEGIDGNLRYSYSLLSSSPISFQFDTGERINSNFTGLYNYKNLIAAATVARYFNIDISCIVKSLEIYYPSMNRSQWIEKNGVNFFLDAYNANPSSVQLLIEEFSTSGKKEEFLIVLGDMLELGDISLVEHKKVLDALRLLNFKHVFLLGDEFGLHRDDYPCFTFFKSYIDLEAAVHEISCTEIILKGSRSMKLERLVS